MIKTIIEDSFEKLVEQGSTQAKKAAKTVVKQVAQTFSPTKMWEQILGIDSNPPNPSHPSNSSKSPEFLKSPNSHTPLNFDKLGKSYQNQDSQKTEALKHRLFQLVKRGEEKLLEDKKKDEQEKKQKEIYEVDMKKKREAERKQQEQFAEIPRGRVRRSIFSHKKVAQRQHAETKPATGKQ